MQDMYLFDPMTGLPRLEANPKLVELALRQRAEKEMLDKISKIEIKIVNSEPEWSKCFNISWSEAEDENFYEMNKEILHNHMAAKLVHDCVFPLEIVRNNRAIWVRTGI